MAQEKKFNIKKILETVAKKHLYLDLFEATGYFMKHSDTRVEVQYYLNPLAIARTTLISAINNANAMEEEYVVRKKILIFTPKNIIISADNLANAKVSEKEVEWVMDKLEKRKAADPNVVVSMLLLIEMKVGDIK